LKRTDQKWILILFVLSFCHIVISCGIYSFSGSTLPAHIKTVAVPLLENQTPEFGIDQQLTEALISAITKDNSLKISSSRSADSILKGTILSIRESAGAYDKNETASGFRVTITIKLSFEDIKKRKVLWEENWSHWGSYETDREEGIQEAIDKLTTDILNKTVSGW
jgi:hypothetical protein